jgi:Ca2+:H+ antiporter
MGVVCAARQPSALGTIASGGNALLSYLETRTRLITLVALVATLAALVGRSLGVSPVAVFILSGLALAGLAAMVGEGTEQLSRRFGPSATGVLQSALGNLPEFFIGVFALRAGLVDVVRAALIGSILANTLLVLGLAFIAGGLRHGAQKFGGDQTRTMSTLLLLAVAAMAIPTIASAPGGPDRGHETEISVVVSIVLLVVFAASIPFSMGKGGPAVGSGATDREAGAAAAVWPLALALAVLTGAGIGAAFVSDWFVDALQPAMATLGMSQEFAGLVVVAIAGNAVENVVGVQAMLADKGDLAISIILNSSLQVALALTPILVFGSLLLGGTTLTLVVSPLLIASLALATLLAALVVIDGESTWLEGLALVGLYVIIAASVWWGAPIAG